MSEDNVEIYYLPKRWCSEVGTPDCLPRENGYINCEKLWSEFYLGANVKNVLNSTFDSDNDSEWSSNSSAKYLIKESLNGEIVFLKVEVVGYPTSKGELKRALALGHVIECNLYFPRYRKVVSPGPESLEPFKFLLRRPEYDK